MGESWKIWSKIGEVPLPRLIARKGLRIGQQFAIQKVGLSEIRTPLQSPWTTLNPLDIDWLYYVYIYKYIYIHTFIPWLCGKPPCVWVQMDGGNTLCSSLCFWYVFNSQQFCWAYPSFLDMPRCTISMHSSPVMFGRRRIPGTCEMNCREWQRQEHLSG